MSLKQDKFLVGILVGIGLLVVIALAAFFLRRGQEGYMDESTPEGVVHNFALALDQQDYQRAYGYLADLPGKPTYTQFRQSYLNDMNVSQNGIQVGRVLFQTAAEASVEVRVIYNRGEIFAPQSRVNDTAMLQRQGNDWKITKMPYPYWQWGWFQATPVKLPPPQ